MLHRLQGAVQIQNRRITRGFLTVRRVQDGAGRTPAVLGRVPIGTWRRFAPAASPVPKDRGRLHRGRVHVVQGGDTVRQAQVLRLTGPEALGRATGVS